MRVILCGYGVVGRNVAAALDLYGVDYTVVERNSEVKVEDGVRVVYGDAKEEEVLHSAGIDHADTLIACTGSDAENAFIVLAAQDLNPEMTIVARAEKLESVDKLYLAGADFVVPLADIAAKSLAKYAVLPFISEFKDRLTVTKSLEISTVRVTERSNLIGAAVGNAEEIRLTGVKVIGIKRGDAIIPNPVKSAPILPEDLLIVLGHPEQIKVFARLIREKG